MSKRMLAERLTAENGHQAHPVEPVSLPLARTWYVQVQQRQTGRLIGRPFVFGQQSAALAAIQQLESEHRDMGVSDRYDVVCWAE